MPIELVTGPANSGKASVLLATTRARVVASSEPLLVVPTRADQARYRRELAEGGGAFGVRVERFDGLFAEIVARAVPGPPAIGSLARERLIARVAGARPGLARELARTIAQLEAERVLPARLRGAVRAWAAMDERSGLGRRDSDQLELFAGDSPEDGAEGPRSTIDWLCGVYERYRQALGAMRRVDREQCVLAALDSLRRRPSLWRGTPVAVYGFDDLTELQLDTLETLGTVVDADLAVSLAYEPGRLAFAGRAASFQRLAPLAGRHVELPPRADHYAAGSRPALGRLERSLFVPCAERVATGGAVRLLAASSPRAELELVVREVRLLLDDGVPAQQIAIAHRSPQQVGPLLAEMLSAQGVAHVAHRRLAFADTAIGRALLGVLRCALGLGSLGDLLAWLRAPGMLDRPDFADDLEARALRVGALSAERARSLWEAERWPLDRIDRLREAAAAGLPVLVDALASELQRLFVAPRRRSAALLGERELDEAQALASGRRALEQLCELDRLTKAASDGPKEALELLDGLQLRPEDPSAAGCVAVVDPLGLRARRVRMLFVCGMQEGVFPAPAAPSLIDEQERRALASASGLALRAPSDTLAAERYLFYALCSRPEDRLTLSWHTAGEDGTPLARSLFVDDVCDVFEPIEVGTPASAGTPTSSETLTSAGTPASAGVPASAGMPSSETLTSAGVPTSSSTSTTADTPVREASGGPIEALRDERVLGELRERRLWSASSLELWASCPVKWFVERLLAGERLGPDAEPLRRGALAHAVLKTTLERLRERTGSARLTAASLATAKLLLAEALDELVDVQPLSTAPERVSGARRRLARELERYLEAAAECPSPLEPTYLELEFGFAEEGPPPLDLGYGVLLRGRIDRVDVGPDGEAVVYDYKGRSVPPSARWLTDRSWQVALYMRAAGELLDVRPIGGFYQPLGGSELTARGALDGDAGVDLDCVRTDRLERAAFERLLEDCIVAARDAAIEARSGALSPRPDTCAYGGGCAYPAICRCER